MSVVHFGALVVNAAKAYQQKIAVNLQVTVTEGERNLFQRTVDQFKPEGKEMANISGDAWKFTLHMDTFGRIVTFPGHHPIDDPNLLTTLNSIKHAEMCRRELNPIKDSKLLNNCVTYHY